MEAQAKTAKGPRGKRGSKEGEDFAAVSTYLLYMVVGDKSNPHLPDMPCCNRNVEGWPMFNILRLPLPKFHGVMFSQLSGVNSVTTFALSRRPT